MKDWLLGVHVVVKNLKLEIWPCRFADCVNKCYSTKLHGARAARLLFLIQPIISLLPGVFLFCCRRLCLIREFKEPRRQLQLKRRIKIELCIKLSLWRLGSMLITLQLVQNRRTALSLTWHEWFSCKGKEWKIYSCELVLSLKPQIWKFHVVVCQTTSKRCTKKRAAHAARLFFFIQPIKSLICGVVVDIAVVNS